MESELAPFITTYVVERVPVRLPHCRDRADLDYMDHAPGLYPDVLRLTNRLYLMDMLHQIVFELNTPQELILSTWFHCDCLADYFFSERHWKIIESFLRCYVERGMNAVLTPIFPRP